MHTGVGDCTGHACRAAGHCVQACLQVRQACPPCGAGCRVHAGCTCMYSSHVMCIHKAGRAYPDVAPHAGAVLPTPKQVEARHRKHKLVHGHEIKCGPGVHLVRGYHLRTIGGGRSNWTRAQAGASPNLSGAGCSHADAQVLGRTNRKVQQALTRKMIFEAADSRSASLSMSAAAGRVNRCRQIFAETTVCCRLGASMPTMRPQDPASPQGSKRWAAAACADPLVLRAQLPGCAPTNVGCLCLL